ncbi:MAG: hypothetical protein IJ837_00960, partial [Clostridia bacterium]|nr:hypothetical protein [Clostridia bacterium]
MVKVWWQYLTMFIIALIAGASFTILTFSPMNNILETSATGKVVSSIMNARDAKVDFDLNFEKDNTKISASGNFVMDLDEETGNISIDVDLNLNINNTPSKVHITYKDNYAYVLFNEQKLRFETTNLLDDLKSSFALIEPALSEIELPFDVSQISMDKIQGLATEATEKKFDNYYEVYFPIYKLIPELGTAVIQANLDYEPTKIYLMHDENLTNRFNLSFNATTNLSPQEIKIEVNEEQKSYTNMSDAIKLLSLALNSIKENGMFFDAELNSSDIKLTSRAGITLSPLKAQLNLNLSNSNVTIVFEDNTLFLDALGIKVKASTKEIKDLISKYASKNIEIPTEVSSIAGANLAFEQILEKVNSFDLSEITNIIKRTQEEKTAEDGSEILNYDIFKINLAEFSVEIISQNNSIETISLFGLNSSSPIMLLKTTEDDFEFLEINQDEYANSSVVTEKADFIQELLNTKKAILNLDANIFGTSYKIDAKVDFADDLKIELSTKFLDNELLLTYIDSTIYLKYKDIKIRTSLSDIQSITNNLSDFVKNNAELNQLVESLLNIISSQVVQAMPNVNMDAVFAYIDKLSLNSKGLTLNLSENNFVSIVFEDELTNNILVNYNNLKLDAKIEIDKDLTILAPTNYDDLLNILPSLEFLEKLYTQKEISLALTFDYEDISIEAEIQAKLNADDLYSSQFMLQTNVLNKPLKLVYKNKVLYLTYKDVSLNITLDELQNILTENSLPSSFEEMQDKLSFGDLTSILTTDKTFAELKPLENVLDEKTLNLVFGIANLIYENIDNFIFSLDENGVMLALNNSNLNVAYSNSSVAGISLDYNDYNIALSDISFETNITSPENSVSYETLKNVYNSVYNYVLNKQFAFNVSAVYNDDVYSADVLLDIQNEAKVKINTTYEGININLVLIGEDIYITISKNGSAYSLKSSLEDIQGILDIASEYFEFDKQYILDLINSYRGYLTAPTQKLNEELDSVTLPAFDIKQILSYLNKDINFDLALIENKNSLNLVAGYDEHNIQAMFENNSLKSISYFGNIYNITQISLNAIEFENITAPESYINTADLIKLYKSVLNTLNTNKLGNAFSFEISGNINLKLNNLSLNIPLVLGIDTASKQAYLYSEFKGINLKVV